MTKEKPSGEQRGIKKVEAQQDRPTQVLGTAKGIESFEQQADLFNTAADMVSAQTGKPAEKVTLQEAIEALKQLTKPADKDKTQ
jgi:hypothetical protein